MNLEIQSAKLVLSLVDTETGEIMTKEATLGDFKDVAKKATTTRTRKPKDDNPNPQITLLEGKIQMNNACVQLVGWEPEMKIDICFEKQGRKITPIIKEDESKGNRLTKTFNVSCRGSKHDNLAEYGTVFDVIPYEGHEGWFKLKGDAPEKEDDIIDVPEEISNPDEDESLGIGDEEPGVEAADIDFDLNMD
jgi:hypothetical protein